MTVITMICERPLSDITDERFIDSPEAAYAMIAPIMANAATERTVVVSLTTKHEVLAVDTIGVGTIDKTFMSPREVFRVALARNAGAVFVAHNHPSGIDTPSFDDIQVTHRIHAAAELIGVNLLDHLIVTDKGFHSMLRSGHLPLR